jgi:hypothetical protein
MREMGERMDKARIARSKPVILRYTRYDMTDETDPIAAMKAKLTERRNVNVRQVSNGYMIVFIRQWVDENEAAQLANNSEGVALTVDDLEAAMSRFFKDGQA